MGQSHLQQAHVAVIGLGGVGSWAAEALARSGVGSLTLVDMDDVCISNVNRQLHAVSGEYGRPKVEALAERLKTINPDATLHPVQAFYTPKTADDILGRGLDYVIDAIDDTVLKCHLIATCRQRTLPLVTAGGAGGRRDPTLVRTADLAFSTHDGLLQEVRRVLRREFGFPSDQHPFGVDAVFSTEPQVFPTDNGEVCSTRPPKADLRLDCNSGYGTASFVTGAFGFAAAATAVTHLAGS